MSVRSAGRQEWYDFLEKETLAEKSIQKEKRSESLEASVHVRSERVKEIQDPLLGEAEMLGRILLSGLHSREVLLSLVQKCERLVVGMEALERRLENIEREIAKVEISIRHVESGIKRVDYTMIKTWDQTQELRKEYEEYLDAQTTPDPKPSSASQSNSARPRPNEKLKAIRDRLLHEAESIIKANDIPAEQVTLKAVVRRLGIKYHEGIRAWGSATEFRNEVRERFGKEA